MKTVSLVISTQLCSYTVCKPHPISLGVPPSQRAAASIRGFLLKFSSDVFLHIIGSLSTRVFETRTATGREQFAFLDRIVSQMFILFISNEEKILSNVNVVV